MEARLEVSGQIGKWAEEHRAEAIELVRRLVRINSVNHPPTGLELECQQAVAAWLRAEGAETEIYSLAAVQGLEEHPAYMAGRNYENRPNVVGRFAGVAPEKSRSLMFSSHIDTVYEGKETWTHPPFAGARVEGRLYGRGAYDMRGGLAASMMAVKCLRDLGVTLAGDVYIESVVDEEYGGANGTLAGRLRGLQADMAIIPEPSNLRVYPGHLGGGMWKASLSGRSGIAFNGEKLASAVEAAADFVRVIREYNVFREETVTAPDLWRNGKKAAAAVLSVFSGDQERVIQEKVPALAEVNFWIEGYPGQKGDEVLDDFRGYMKSRLGDYPALAGCGLEITPLLRYLEASELRQGEAVSVFLELAARKGRGILGDKLEEPCGAPFACDGFMFNLYSRTPALILGPSGGNAHAADEFLDLDSYMTLIRWYAEMIAEWCGAESSFVKSGVVETSGAEAGSVESHSVESEGLE